MSLLLGIEIGGTKLQLGVGRGDGSALVMLARREIDPHQGAQGILRQIEEAAGSLAGQYPLKAIGCGFGGPVDSQRGWVIKSHQISGWDNFALAAWLQQHLGLPAVVGNDCDAAALAEAHFGAGRGERVVFYVTVGTGIGGGLIVDGQVFQGSGLAAAEIGHLRPGINASQANETVESVASGWGVASAARIALRTAAAGDDHAHDLRNRCADDVEQLTARMVGEAAEAGNALAAKLLLHAVQTLGWAVAQAITLLSPQVVVVGGGLSLLPRGLFLDPLKEAVEQYVFPPLRGSYRIEAAQLGEEVVVHGALALACAAFSAAK